MANQWQSISLQLITAETFGQGLDSYNRQSGPPCKWCRWESSHMVARVSLAGDSYSDPCCSGCANEWQAAADKLKGADHGGK